MNPNQANLPHPQPNPDPDPAPAQLHLSRRQALKVLATLGGATGLTTLPSKWIKPVVEVGLLPAQAQISPPIIPPLGSEFAVMGTTSDGNLIVVFPTANTNLPTPTQNSVPGLPAGAQPHGVSYFGNAGGLVSDFGRSQVFVIDLETNALTDTILTGAAGYNGMGTIAAAPGSEYALACGGNATLIAIAAPFNAGSSITALTLPGEIATYQTQAIVFDNAKRAFVYHTTGISVLEPPYTSINFTIPFDNASGGVPSGAIAISPGGNTLLTTTFDENMYIFNGPFSASTVPAVLAVGSTVTGQIQLDLISDEVNPMSASFNNVEALQGDPLDGINITPDGGKALICAGLSGDARVFAVSAPFNSASVIEEIPLPPALADSPEDIGISPDGQLAIVTGGSSEGSPAAFIRAPFTAAEAQVFAVDIIGGGRGAGAVRFQPPNTR